VTGRHRAVEQAAPAHETWVTQTAHWKGGARFYARCRCGWIGRQWSARRLAVIDGEAHSGVIDPGAPGRG